MRERSEPPGDEYVESPEEAQYHIAPGPEVTALVLPVTSGPVQILVYIRPVVRTFHSMEVVNAALLDPHIWTGAALYQGYKYFTRNRTKTALYSDGLPRDLSFRNYPNRTSTRPQLPPRRMVYRYARRPVRRYRRRKVYRKRRLSRRRVRYARGRGRRNFGKRTLAVRTGRYSRMKLPQFLTWKNTRIQFSITSSAAAINYNNIDLLYLTPDVVANMVDTGTVTSTVQTDFGSSNAAVTGCRKVFLKHILLKGRIEFNQACQNEGACRLVVYKYKGNDPPTWNPDLTDFFNFRDYHVLWSKFLRTPPNSNNTYSTFKYWSLKLPLNRWIYTPDHQPATTSADWQQDALKKIKLRFDTNADLCNGTTPQITNAFTYKIVYGIPPAGV